MGLDRYLADLSPLLPVRGAKVRANRCGAGPYPSASVVASTGGDGVPTGLSVLR